MRATQKTNADLLTWDPVEAAGKLKAQNPGALVLIKVGDYYESYGDDAKICAKLLEHTLMLLTRNRPAPVPHMFFPHYRLDAYCKLLVAAGHRVSVCDAA